MVHYTRYHKKRNQERVSPHSTSSEKREEKRTPSLFFPFPSLITSLRQVGASKWAETPHWMQAEERLQLQAEEHWAIGSRAQQAHYRQQQQWEEEEEEGDVKRRWRQES